MVLVGDHSKTDFKLATHGATSLRMNSKGLRLFATPARKDDRLCMLADEHHETT